MPRGLNRSGDFRNGSPITLPHTFGNPITQTPSPKNFGNAVTWPTPNPAEFGNAVTWTPSPAHFGNIIGTTTYSISGTISGAGGPSATVTLTGAASATTTADGSGNYSFAGLSNGTYTITPTNAGYTFTPTSLSETISNANITGANFSSALTGYSAYKTVTVLAAAVGSGGAVDFPVLVTGTFAYLAGTGSGGSVTNANGYDIIFSSTNNLTSPTILPFERRSYNATTGAVVFHVQFPSVSSATNTSIYMLYGNAAVTTDQSNPTGVWDANFLQVSHLDGASASQIPDSTSNGNNSTANTGTSTTGQWGTAMAFAAASSQLATFPAIFGSAPAAFTIESWVKFPTATGNYGVGYDGRSVGGAGPLLYMIETSGFAAIFNDALQTSGNSNIGNNAWHCLQARLSGTNLSILVDGNLFGGTGAQGTTPWSAGHLGVSFPTPAAYFNGSNQELRISNIARSNAWLSTTYNNQSLPTSGAGFYTVA